VPRPLYPRTTPGAGGPDQSEVERREDAERVREAERATKSRPWWKFLGQADALTSHRRMYVSE
jgi:hypothetical protein